MRKDSKVDNQSNNKDEKYKAILDDWYNSGMCVEDGTTDGLHLVAEGLYDPYVIKEKQTIYRDGLASLLMDGADKKKVNEEIYKSYSGDLWDTAFDSMKEDFTDEEMKKIVYYVWNGVDADKTEDVELIGKLKDDQFQHIVKCLNRCIDHSNTYLYGENKNIQMSFQKKCMDQIGEIDD